MGRTVAMGTNRKFFCCCWLGAVLSLSLTWVVKKESRAAGAGSSITCVAEHAGKPEQRRQKHFLAVRHCLGIRERTRISSAELATKPKRPRRPGVMLLPLCQEGCSAFTADHPSGLVSRQTRPREVRVGPAHQSRSSTPAKDAKVRKGFMPVRAQRS